MNDIENKKHPKAKEYPLDREVSSDLCKNLGGDLHGYVKGM